MKPKVTVILPFYENGQELDTAIASISDQTFSDWEFLLVNNNAAAVGKTIADKWIGNDRRVKQIFEQQQGIANALNTGLQHAAGQYIARMDGDDISFPERLHMQVDFLDKNPGISVVSTQTAFSSELSKSEGYEIFTQWQNRIITNQEHYLARFIESPFAHPTVMFRSKLIKEFGFYDPGNLPEDYELWLRWFDNGVGFYKIPEPLVLWNDHEQRLSRNHENYSKEAFFTVKIRYMAKWIKRSVSQKRKFVICGSSKIIRKRAEMLQNEGVNVFGFTDVKASRNRAIRFIPLSDLTHPEKWFIINFISKRGVGEAIRRHFSGLGFIEGTDFISGA